MFVLQNVEVASKRDSHSSSRSIRQKTQASLASTQELFLNAATLSFTGYGAQAYYNDDGAIAPSASLMLAPKNKIKDKPRRPPSGGPQIARDFTAEGSAADEAIAVDYGDAIYLTRFDYLWGLPWILRIALPVNGP